MMIPRLDVWKASLVLLRVSALGGWCAMLGFALAIARQVVSDLAVTTDVVVGVVLVNVRSQRHFALRPAAPTPSLC